VRVAIYTPISTDEERQPYSLEAQDTRLGAYIASEDGWELTRRYSDRITGSGIWSAAARAMWYPKLSTEGVPGSTFGNTALLWSGCGNILPMAGQTWGASVGFRAVRPGSKVIQWTQRLLAVITAVGAILTLTVLATRADLGGRALAMATWSPRPIPRVEHRPGQ